MENVDFYCSWRIYLYLETSKWGKKVRFFYDDKNKKILFLTAYIAEQNEHPVSKYLVVAKSRTASESQRILTLGMVLVNISGNKLSNIIAPMAGFLSRCIITGLPPEKHFKNRVRRILHLAAEDDAPINKNWKWCLY